MSASEVGGEESRRRGELLRRQEINEYVDRVVWRIWQRRINVGMISAQWNDVDQVFVTVNSSLLLGKLNDAATLSEKQSSTLPAHNDC